MSTGNGQDAFENTWVPDTADDTVARAQSLAHATLVQTSLKVASVRAAAQSVLLDAHTEAEEVLMAAREAAETVRRAAQIEAEEIALKVLAEAHRNANTITDRALDQRDMLLTGTLERIAALSTGLMGMADQIIAHAANPAAARGQLAQFMLALSDMAEAVNHDDSDDTFGTGRVLEAVAA